MFKHYFELICQKAPGFTILTLNLCDKAKFLDFLAPLAIRLYLVPVFWMAGTKKFANFSSTVEWFGNEEWGLGLPLPFLLTLLVALVEVLGALFLLIGFGVRLISIPLMLTMVVAAITVHLENGWLAIASGDGIFSSERTIAAVERLAKAKEVLQNYANYDWLTEHGGFVILNNGIEFAVTYFIMLLAMFFLGAGRFVSADYWIKKRFDGNNEIN